MLHRAASYALSVGPNTYCFGMLGSQLHCSWICLLLSLMQAKQNFSSLNELSASDQYLEATVELTRLDHISLTALPSQADNLRHTFARMLGISKSQLRVDDSFAGGATAPPQTPFR